MKKRKEFSNWKQVFSKQNMRNMLPLSGGYPNQYFITALIYFALAIFNAVIIFLYPNPETNKLLYSIPFLLFGMSLSFKKIRDTADVIIDIILLLFVTMVSPAGTFSGMVLLYLILFRLKNKKQLYVSLFFAAIAVLMNAIAHDFSPAHIFSILTLYLFTGHKYYVHIHLPTKEMKTQIKTLKTQNSIITRKALTDEEILQKYPFMEHSGEDCFRKIKDIRRLADQLGYKQIGAINGIQMNSQSKEFTEMKKHFSKVVKREIYTVQGLVIAGIEMGIIEVNYIL